MNPSSTTSSPRHTKVVETDKGANPSVETVTATDNSQPGSASQIQPTTTTTTTTGDELPPSTQLTIINSAELAKLKSALAEAKANNAILRNHNLSLLAHNSGHQQQQPPPPPPPSSTPQIIPPTQTNHIIDTTTGEERTIPALLAEYNQTMQQNTNLLRLLHQERTTTSIMAACCEEWVKQETDWKVERDNLRNQITSLSLQIHGDTNLNVVGLMAERDAAIVRIAYLEGGGLGNTFTMDLDMDLDMDIADDDDFSQL